MEITPNNEKSKISNNSFFGRLISISFSGDIFFVKK